MKRYTRVPMKILKNWQIENQDINLVVAGVLKGDE